MFSMWTFLSAFLNGKPINDSNVLLLNDHQQLHIESATEGDAGRYSCVAENKPGRVEKDLIVAVLSKCLKKV
uniref:Ig-like domain-containing protein n=1 Tax=Parascaris equorum TaxID=6256 RepID=A0A914R9W8_PAREQ